MGLDLTAAVSRAVGWLGHTLATCLLWAFLFFALLLLLVWPAHGQTIFADGFERGEPGQPPCPEVPLGMRVAEFTWAGIWYGKEWPEGNSFLTPIGSWTLRRGSPARPQPIAGVIITTPIVMDGLPHKLGWVGAQPIPAAGYGLAYAADAMTVTVSRCRADIAAECGGTASGGNVFYGPGVAVKACRFPAGTPLWVSWTAWDFGLTPLGTTCSDKYPALGVRCDANFESR
jgi:hypothetical protein